MKDITMLSHLNSMAPPSLNRAQETTAPGFTDMLANAISETNNQHDYHGKGRHFPAPDGPDAQQGR
jgi:hypothetical protein